MMLYSTTRSQNETQILLYTVLLQQPFKFEKKDEKNTDEI